jgi:DNA-binding transcriptional regulator GbsR (MarR family)
MAAEVSSGNDHSEVDRFVERFALTLVEAGLPRMPARVFAALLVADRGKLTAAELASRLWVSPAAISGAVRYLIQVHMIERGRDPGERRDYYGLAAEPWYEALSQRDEILSRWIKALGEGIAAVGPDTAAGVRLVETREFFEFMKEELPDLLQRWRDRQDAHRAGRGGYPRVSR